jgi:hypothetical protein
MQHRRLGSEAAQPASNAAEEEEEEAATTVPLPPLPALPVLVQKRASLADIRRKLEEEPASINEKDTTVRRIATPSTFSPARSYN